MRRMSVRMASQASLGDCARNSLGSRFSEEPEREPEERNITYAEDTVFHRAQEPIRPLTPYATAPPTTPTGSRQFVSTTEELNTAAARKMVAGWTAELTKFRKEFIQGFQTYFPKWTEHWFFFNGTRRLLMELDDMGDLLSQLSSEMAILPPNFAEAIETLDQKLCGCMQDSRVVYSRMTQEDNVATGPLEGKELISRKNRIKKDLIPVMKQIAKDFALQKIRVKDMISDLIEAKQELDPDAFPA